MRDHALAGGHLVYRADQERDEVVELYALDLPTEPSSRAAGAPTGSASATVVND